MTLVFTNSDFWIEYLVVANGGNLAAGANNLVNFNVTKSGHLVGIACSGFTTSAGSTSQLEIVIQKADGTLPAFGDTISNDGAAQQLRIRFKNDGAAITTAPSAMVIVLMKK